MDVDIIHGGLGTDGAFDVSFTGGRLVLSAKGSFPPDEQLNVNLSVGARKIVEAMKAAIPGKIDDFAFDLLLAALGA